MPVVVRRMESAVYHPIWPALGLLRARSAGGEAIAFLELLSMTERLRPVRVPGQG